MFRLRRPRPAGLPPAWQRRREQLAAAYDAALAGVPGHTARRPGQGGHAWHLYQVRVNPAARLSRDVIMNALARQQIGTSVHFIPATSAFRLPADPAPR